MGALVAELAVEVEGAGVGIGAGVVGVEADSGLGCAGGDGGVVAGVGQGNGLPVLGEVAVPGLGELLVAAEGPGEGPVIDGRAAGVGDGETAGETAAPVILIRVDDVAVAALRRWRRCSGGSFCGSRSGVRRARAVEDGLHDEVVDGRSREPVGRVGGRGETGAENVGGGGGEAGRRAAIKRVGHAGGGAGVPTQVDLGGGCGGRGQAGGSGRGCGLRCGSGRRTAGAAEGELDGGEGLLLETAGGGGVVVGVEQAVGIFAVERPVGPVEGGVGGEELDEGLEVLALTSGSVVLDVGGVVGGAELTEPEGCDAVLGHKGPVGGPDGGKGAVGRVAVVPGLLVEVGAVLVGGVDKLVGDGEGDRGVADAFEVATPPGVVVVVGVGAFDEEEEFGVDGQDGVSGARGGEVPVIGAAAIPAGTAGVGVMRLIAEVQADHGGVAGVAFCEAGPVVDPGGFRVLRGVPEAARLGAVASLGAVVVEDDPEIEGACGGDDLIEDLEGVETLEVAVDAIGEADAGGSRGGLDHLVGERNTNRVVALGLDGLEDGFVVLRGEASRDGTGGLEAIPVDAGDADDLVVGVKDAVAGGMPVAGPLRIGAKGIQEQDRKEEEEGSAEKARDAAGGGGSAQGGTLQICRRLCRRAMKPSMRQLGRKCTTSGGPVLHEGRRTSVSGRRNRCFHAAALGRDNPLRGRAGA